jgi:hypothetical protein
MGRAMRIGPEISAATIVLRGAFNPSIFQPFWLVRNEIVTEEQGENAQINLIHPQAAEFDIPGQFSLHVDPTTFTITRTEAPLILVSDTAVKIFAELLPHTPTGQLGLNRTVHFSVGSFEERNRIGVLLAPPDPWGAWGTELSSGPSKGKPDQLGGLKSLTMLQTRPPDRQFGHIQATIEPSILIGGGRSGIFMVINDHFQIEDPGKAEGAEEMIDILAGRFDESIRRSESLIDQVMALRK